MNQVCVHSPTSAANVTLPACASACPASCCCCAGRAAIDRYLLPAGQQTRRMLLQRANGTNTRTDTVPLRRPCSTYYALPTKQSNLEVIGFPSWLYRNRANSSESEVFFESVYKNIKPLDKNDILVCSRKTILWAFLKIKTLLFFTLF